MSDINIEIVKKTKNGRIKEIKIGKKNYILEKSYSREEFEDNILFNVIMTSKIV